MPNYCYNILIVEGDEREVEEFIEANRSESHKLDFQNLVPVYMAASNIGAEMKRKWGCKGKPQFSDFTAMPGQVAYSFDTANAPPEDWLEAVVEKYPSLHFNLKYAEPANDYCGEMESRSGDLESLFHGFWSNANLAWKLENFEFCVPVPDHYYQFFTLQADWDYVEFIEEYGRACA